MPRKRGAPRRRPRPATPGNDPYLLDEFSRQDLSTWKRNSALLQEYRVKQFYELESLRELHRDELIKALRDQGDCRETLAGWTRIVDYKYSLEPLSAKGSLRAGGRFNIGRDLDAAQLAPFPALYIASDYPTAYAERFGVLESKSELAPHELSLRTPGSFTSVSLNGEIGGLFDLRDSSAVKAFAKIIGKFQLNKELRQLARQLGMRGPLLLASTRDLYQDLLGNWRGMPSQYGLPANSQLFARFLREAGFEGVIYPSTKGSGSCIALFIEQLVASDSWIEIADDSPAGATARLDASTTTQLF